MKNDCATKNSEVDFPLRAMMSFFRIGRKQAINAIAILLIVFATGHVLGQGTNEKHKSISRSEFLRSHNRSSRKSFSKFHAFQLCGLDARTNANAYEAARLVRIESNFVDGTAYSTGFIVSENCIVTAAHNIFRNGTFATTVKVFFKQQSQIAIELFTVQGYVDNQNDEECDYGSIKLPGSFSGAQTMSYGDDSANGNARVAGFPDLRQAPLALDTNQKPLESDGIISGRLSSLLLNLTGAQATQGQSGSPIFRPKGKAIAIHLEGDCQQSQPVQTGVRIDGPVKANIDKWITN